MAGLGVPKAEPGVVEFAVWPKENPELGVVVEAAPPPKRLPADLLSVVAPNEGFCSPPVEAGVLA